MHSPDINDRFEHIVTAGKAALERYGFRRNRKRYRKISGNMAAIIEFQRSTTNTSSRLLFTVNLAIVCDGLQYPGVPIRKAAAMDGQLTERLGMLLPERRDKWWEITETTNIDALSAEIATLLTTYAIPYLERYLQPSALLALWDSGVSPGLTEKQANECSRKLKMLIQ
jgi:hypothetical protein